MQRDRAIDPREHGDPPVERIDHVLLEVDSGRPEESLLEHLGQGAVAAETVVQQGQRVVGLLHVPVKRHVSAHVGRHPRLGCDVARFQGDHFQHAAAGILQQQVGVHHRLELLGVHGDAAADGRQSVQTQGGKHGHRHANARVVAADRADQLDRIGIPDDLRRLVARTATTLHDGRETPVLGQRAFPATVPSGQDFFQHVEVGAEHDRGILLEVGHLTIIGPHAVVDRDSRAGDRLFQFDGVRFVHHGRQSLDQLSRIGELVARIQQDDQRQRRLLGRDQGHGDLALGNREQLGQREPDHFFELGGRLGYRTADLPDQGLQLRILAHPVAGSVLVAPSQLLGIGNRKNGHRILRQEFCRRRSLGPNGRTHRDQHGQRDQSELNNQPVTLYDHRKTPPS